jgi:O-antigen ligase
LLIWQGLGVVASVSLMSKMALWVLALMPLFLAISRAGADIALSVIAIIFILHSFINRKWDWLKSNDVCLLLIFWFYLCCQSFFLTDQTISLRMIVWIRFIVFYAALSHWLLVDRQSIQFVALAAIPIIALLVIDSYWQYLTGISLSGREYPHPHRIGGPMSHPNIANLLLKTTVPLCGIWVIYAANLRQRKLAQFALAVFILLLVSLVIVSGERSAALLMLLSMLIIATTFFLTKPASRKYVVLSTLLFVGMYLVLLSTQTVVHARSSQLVHQVFTLMDTVYGQLFQAAFYLWTHNPFFGIGTSQFLSQCQVAAEALSLNYCDVHAHNIYLQLLSETGLVGFVLFIVAMVSVVRTSFRHIAAPVFLKSPLIFSIATFCILLWPVIITQSLFTNWPAILFWYSLSLAACYPRIYIKYE